MGQTKNFSHALATGVFLCIATLACANDVHALTGSFHVGVRVVRADAPSRPPSDLPVPPGAQALPGAAALACYRYAGPVVEAARFYREAMSHLGFRLVRINDAGTHFVFEQAGRTVELRLDAVIGTNATRILLTSA
jgi:hypothetical protein